MSALKPCRTVAMSLLVLAAVSCGGGKGVTPPPPEVPVITSVVPQGIIGSLGGWVRFEAEATNNPIEWIWDLTQIGSSSGSSANPRVFLEKPGQRTVYVRAVNAQGSSEVKAIRVDVAIIPTPPTWEQALLGPGGTQPEMTMAITPSVIVIYYLPRTPEGGTVPTFLIQPLNAAESTNWITYRDTVPGRGFPLAGKLRSPQLQAHADKIYLIGKPGIGVGLNSNAVFLACTDHQVPESLSSWKISQSLSPTQIAGSGNDGAAAVLGFVGDKPVLMGTSILRETQITDTSYYTNYIAIANTALPDSDDDWEVLRMPDLIDGFGSGAGKRSPTGRDDAVFNQVAVTLPGGGVCFVQTDIQDDLDFYFAPSESAIRANNWRLKPLGSDVSQRGVPYGMTADARHIYLAYYPANPAVPNDYPRYSRGLGLAMSADPTGIDTPWTFQHLPDTAGLRHFLFSPLVSAPLQVWGGRLIMLAEDDGNIALARALEPGIPGPSGWERQRIAGEEQLGASAHPLDEIYATTATSGLDFFVLYARDSAPESGAPDSPLWLSIAEGSW